jgi:Zn-dependent protease with chaperone function
MTKTRLLFLAIIFTVGAALVLVMAIKRARPPMDSSLVPVFQLLGKPVKSLDRAFTRMIPIDSLDEKEYGEAIARRYAYLDDRFTREHRYLNNIIAHLALMARKPFKYQVFVISHRVPNAFAFPGGVIIVTDGLLGVMESEAEVVAILAHEMGHIERSHCMDAVRFQLLAKKTGSQQLGEIADFAVKLLLTHSFNKTEENEADDYAYRMLLNTPYDPCGLGGSFNRMLRYEGPRRRRSKKAHILRDYFMTHPPFQLRAAEYLEKAKAWWRDHPDEKRYWGESNLRTLTDYHRDNTNPREWRTGPHAGAPIKGVR